MQISSFFSLLFYLSLISLSTTTLAWTVNYKICHHQYLNQKQHQLVNPSRRTKPLCAQEDAQSDVNSNTTIEIPIIYESERILVVNKPPGISHHDDVSEGLPGMVTRVREQCGKRVWGVHRLDKVTSGILVFAKDVDMAKALTAAFAKGEISKVYLGISAKRPTKKKQGWVKGGMVKSRDKSWKLTRDVTKKFAKTRFFTTPLLYGDQKFTLLLFRPYTGRTHQLRVCAKSVGLPLWGDPIYRDGTVSATEDDSKRQPNRTYLHASGITIPALLDSSDAISLWSFPSFQDVIQYDSEAIANLMKKHCDLPEIVSILMERMNA